MDSKQIINDFYEEEKISLSKASTAVMFMEHCELCGIIADKIYIKQTKIGDYHDLMIDFSKDNYGFGVKIEEEGKIKNIIVDLISTGKEIVHEKYVGFNELSENIMRFCVGWKGE